MSIASTITTSEHLTDLPVGTLVIDAAGDLHRKVEYDADSCGEWLALDQSVRAESYIVETEWQMLRRLPASIVMMGATDAAAVAA